MSRSFTKKVSSYEYIKLYFENDLDNAPMITERYEYDFNGHYTKTPVFTCSNCNESYKIKDLTFKNKKIICKCGCQFSIDEVRPMEYYSNDKDIEHNLNNNTFNKVNVPKIINHEMFYCNECHSVTKMNKMKLNNKQRVCPVCNKSYSFNDCKIGLLNEYNYTHGAVYFEGNKINLVCAMYFSSLNNNGLYYWNSGKERLTLNLETGYSYISRSGQFLSDMNSVYRRVYGDTKKAPGFFNASYSNGNNILSHVCNAIASQMFIKYKDSHMVKKICKNPTRLYKLIGEKLFNKIDNYMTDYFNNKYCYRIYSINEQLKMYNDKSFALGMHDTDLLIAKNRFINAQFAELLYTIPNIVRGMRVSADKPNYKALPRESSNILLDYICNSTKASKGLRKKVSAKSNKYSKEIVVHDDRIITCRTIDNMSEQLHSFVNVAKHFKIKENVNKLYKTCVEDINAYECCYWYSKEETMKFWLNYRNEHYISNLDLHELCNRVYYMDKSLGIIKSIIELLGDDWTINSVEFRNEKQFHDDLYELSRSEALQQIRESKEAKANKASFRIEKDALALQEEDNNIFIAKNNAMLINLGQKMGICVGSYGNSVKSGGCRIVYMTNSEGDYKACIELARRKDAITKKYEYTIKQAKLCYNALAHTDEYYYNKILDWAERHDIEIDTEDMISRDAQRDEVDAEVLEF